MNTGLDAYKQMDAEIAGRIKADPELASLINSLDDEHLEQFRQKVYSGLAEDPKYRVVYRDKETVVVPKFFDGIRVDMPTEMAPRTRKPRAREIEELYHGYKTMSESAAPLDKLSPEQRVSLREIAEEEGRDDIAALFKFDGRYLAEYYRALEQMTADARKMQADPKNPMNTPLGEVKRGFAGPTYNLGNAAMNTYRRWRGGVPFGNPDNLNNNEILDRAWDDAAGQVSPYFAGTKDYEDIRAKAGFMRKLLRGAGEIASYAAPTPQGLLFGSGAKAAGKLAAGKITNGFAGAAARMGAGSAAASPVYSLADIKAPVEQQGAGDIAANVAAEIIPSALEGAALGAGLHGLGQAAMRATLSRFNPAYKTVFKNEAADFARYVSRLNARRENGAKLSPREGEFLNHVVEQARADGQNVEDILSGKIGAEYYWQQLRPWTRNIPGLGDLAGILPEGRRHRRYVPTPDAAEPAPKGEPFDARKLKQDGDAAVAAANPPKPVLPIGVKTQEQFAAEANSEPKFSAEEPFGGGEKLPQKFESADDFTDFLLSNDVAARRVYDYLRYTENRRDYWNANYLPEFAKKYGAKVGGLNLTERAFTRRKTAEAYQKLIDAIPDEEVSEKLELIGNVPEAFLSDAHVEYAANHGDAWARLELEKRMKAAEKAASEEFADNIFTRLVQERAKLPTPKSMRENGGELASEMEHVYNSLPADLRLKYFTGAKVKTDDLAMVLGYADENAMFDALSEGARAVAEKRLNPDYDEDAPVLPQGLKPKAKNTTTEGAEKISSTSPEPTEEELAAAYGTAQKSRPFADVAAESFKPRAETALESEAQKRAKELQAARALSPREWRERKFPNLTDRAIAEAKSQKSGGALQNFKGDDTYLRAFNGGKFGIVRDGEGVLKRFENEAEARAFVDEWNDAAAELVQIRDSAMLEARGGAGERERFVKYLSEGRRIQGVQMFRPRSPARANEMYDQMLEFEKRSVDAERARAAELARREFEDESDFKDWLRDNSDEANDAFDRIRDEMLKAADGDKYRMDDLELYRRQNQWLDNNLKDLLRVYGAKIKEPKPEPESDAEGNVETGGRPSATYNIVNSKPAPSDMPTDANSPTIIDDMKRWALNFYKDKTVKMPDENGTARDVSIDKRGIKEAMNHLRKRVSEDKKRLFIKTMPSIVELLESAKFNGKPQNKHKGQKLDIYKYEVGFRDNSQDYRVDITIKENLDGKFYYDHNLTKIETLGVQKNSDVKTSTSSVYALSSSDFPKSQENFYKTETEADAFEGSSGSYIIDGIGSVDPQGRFTPDRFAADPANIAANARETWDKLKSMLKIADDIEGGTPLELAEKIGSQIELWRTKLDPKMTRLPELVQLANSLMTQPVGVRRRMGNALGVFTHGLGGRYSKIDIRADMFEWVNDAERFTLAEQAADKILGYMGKSDIVAEGRTLSEKIAEIEANGGQQTFLAAYEKLRHDYAREKKQTGGITASATAVLAHEIGHLIDFIPDGVIRGRGNILGHLARLYHFNKTTIPIFKNGVGLSEEKRAELRQQAKFEVAAEMGNPDLANYWKVAKTPDKERLKEFNKKVSERYAEIVAEYCAKHAILTRDVATKELLKVIAWWQGVKPEQVPLYFAKQPKEMYAEAFSCFFGNPQKFAELAPTVNKTIFARMRDKREVWNAWEEFQRHVNNAPARTQRIINDTKEMFNRAQRRDAEVEIALEKERKKLGKEKLAATFWSEYQPIYNVAAKIAKAAGLPRETLTAAIDNDRYRMSKVELYATELNNRVFPLLRDNGLTLGDVGTFMMARRVITERADIANPLGLQPSDAKAIIDDMLANLSKPQKNALVKAVREFHGLRKRFIIEPMKQLYVFSPELTEKIADNMEYSTFAASKNEKINSGIETLLRAHVGDVGAGIYKQFGNIGDIKNPLAATIQKDSSLILFLSRQRATREFVSIMKRGASDMISPAEERFDRNTMMKVPVEKDTPDIATVKVLRGGKVKAYYVPRVYAEAFLTHNADALERSIRAFNGVFKGLFTRYNPMFWTKGAIRDIRTELERLPSPEEMGAFKGRLHVAKEMAREYPRAFKDSFMSTFAAPRENIAKALDRGLVVSRAEWMGDNPNESEAERILRRFGFNPDGLTGAAPKTPKQKKLDFLARLWLAFGNIGQISERASKVAAMQYMDKNFPKMTEAERARFVREVGGSPDFNNRPARSAAAWLDLGFLYFNPRLRGLEAALRNWKRDPKQALAALTIYGLPSALLNWAFTTGAFGVAAAILYQLLPTEWADNMVSAAASTSNRDRMMYDVWPLPDGHVIMIPKEDNTRYLTHCIDGLLRGEPLGAVADVLKGELQSTSPVVQILWNMATFATGGNPRNIDGMEIIPPDENLTAHWTKGSVEMGKYIWNETLGSPTGLQVSRYGDADRSFVDSVINFPLLRPFLGNFIRKPRGGAFELVARDARELETEQAQARIDRRDLAKTLADGGKLSSGQIETLKNNIDDSRHISDIQKRAIVEKIRKSDPAVAKIMSGNNKMLQLKQLKTLRDHRLITEDKYKALVDYLTK